MIDSKTKLMGIFGYPLGHTFSPLMHNGALHKLGLNYAYLPMEVRPENLEIAVKAIPAFDMLGVNVTIPYKEKVMKYLDYISPEAKACGAVNLIKNENGKLLGYNTDGAGFIAGLREADLDIAGHLVLIGAGGAARAVAYALAKEAVESITILDIDQRKALDLATFITEQAAVPTSGHLMSQETFNDLASGANMIINCTPVGMYPYINEMPVADISEVKKALLCDLIYNPLQTKFLARGKAQGLLTLNGLPMLIHQGALTFKILTGQNPPIAFMKEVILNQMQ